jgi:two-component system LytT family response regulator
MYNILIVEDELKLALSLKTVLGMVAQNCQVTAIAASIMEARQLIDDLSPDIVFLDVELSDGLSFDLLEQLPEITFEIVFVTAHSNYALNAFKYSAIDFVVKPIDPDDIENAVLRAIDSISKKDIGQRIKLLLQNKNESPANQRIILQTADSVYYVPIKDIVHCESDINYTTFYTADAKSIVVSKTLGDFEKILPSFFYRVHRSHLVNLNFVSQVKKRTGECVLFNEQKIPVSSRKMESLLLALKDFMV